MNNTLEKMYRRLLYFRREMLAYIHYIIGKKATRQVKVVIFAQGRTGSTLLEKLISNSGDFKSHVELLNVKKRGEVLFPVPFIVGLSRRNKKQHFIFHVKIYQLTRDRKYPVDPLEFLQKLQDDGWKIIYLRRNNKVRHRLSNMVANARGNYFKFDTKKEEIRLNIDIDSFVKSVKGRIKFERDERKILKNLEYFEVVYEDDLEKSKNHKQTVTRIFDYLGLESNYTPTELKKVNTHRLKDLILNYEEFEKRMIKEGWAEFLD